MGKFWIRFAINEAITVAEAFIGGTKLTEAQKASAEKLIAAGQEFLATL